MKDLSLKHSEIFNLVAHKNIKSISFDIDGTVYPLRKVELRWWSQFFKSPAKAIRFYLIRKRWEKRRQGMPVEVKPEEVAFFEEFLSNMLSVDLVPAEIHQLMTKLQKRNVKIFFLSDHGAETKMKLLHLMEYGQPINCLHETNELKPHKKISKLLKDKYSLEAKSHLHLGDRWTDEAQAKDFGCYFVWLKTK